MCFFLSFFLSFSLSLSSKKKKTTRYRFAVGQSHATNKVVPKSSKSLLTKTCLYTHNCLRLHKTLNYHVLKKKGLFSREGKDFLHIIFDSKNALLWCCCCWCCCCCCCCCLRSWQRRRALLLPWGVVVVVSDLCQSTSWSFLGCVFFYSSRKCIAFQILFSLSLSFPFDYYYYYY